MNIMFNGTTFHCRHCEHITCFGQQKMPAVIKGTEKKKKNFNTNSSLKKKSKLGRTTILTSMSLTQSFSRPP